MKKLFLLAAVLLGAATASQAGVRFSFGVATGCAPAESVIISRPAPVVTSVCTPAPVIREVVAPSCETAATVVRAPICEPAPVVVSSPVWAPRELVARRPVHYTPYRHDFHPSRPVPYRSYPRADLNCR